MAAGLSIALGLDISEVDKSLKDMEKKIKETLKQVTSKGNSFKFDSSQLTNVEKKTANKQGTDERKIADLKAYQLMADKLNLSEEKSRNTLVDIQKGYYNIKETVKGTSVDLEKLYNLQKQYEALTGKKYQTSGFADIEKVQELISIKKAADAAELARKADIAARNKADDVILKAMIAEEAAAKAAAIKQTQTLDQQFYDLQTANMTKVAKAEEAARNAKNLARKKEIEETFKQQDDIQKRAERIDAIRQSKGAMSMPIGTVDQYKAKIAALEKVQAHLNITNEAGKKKYTEVTREIERSKKAVQDLTTKKKELGNVANDLTKRLLAVFSIQAAKQFFMQVVQIGGELERQRIALSIIIDDASKANILFSKIKAQALESPFTFKDIISSTRQLSAYNIEAEKLYDTQFMLSELSAGLGVEMNRLILAYGQVKAATVLRGQELRQFTEAGIPIIQALADKFTQLEGRVVSTGEVFQKVSDRLVPFKMVDEILRGMTEEGGKFYEMQAKQAETVIGQWTNLRDSWDMMYMDIEKSNRGFLMSLIKGMRSLIENWEVAYGAIGTLAVAAGAYYVLSFYRVSTLIGKEVEYTGVLLTQAKVAKIRNAAILGGIGAVVLGLALVIGYTIKAATEMSRYKKQLQETAARNISDGQREVDGLKVLITQMQKAVVGSTEYKNIKDKISTQYGQYLPMLITEATSVMDIANAYKFATAAIKANYAAKAMEENYATLQEDSGIKKAKGGLKDKVYGSLKDMGMSDYESGAVTAEYMRLAEEMALAGKKIDDTKATLNNIAKDFGIKVFKERDELKNAGENNFSTQSILDKGTVRLRQIGELYSSYISEVIPKMKAIENVNNSNFGKLAEGIKKNLDEVTTGYDKSVIALLRKTSNSLEKELIKEQSDINKKAATSVAETLNSINGLFSNSKFKLKFSLKDIFNIDTGELIPESAFIKLATDSSITASSGAIIYKRLVDSVFSAAGTTNIEKQTGNFFKELNESIIKEADGNEVSNERLKTNNQLRLDAAVILKGQVGEYKSLNEFYALFDAKEAASKNVERLKASATALEEEVKALKTKTWAIVQLKIAQDALAETNTDLYKNEQLIAFMDLMIKQKGLITPAPKGGGGTGTDPAIERANRLISLYKTMKDSYSKYAKVLSETEAKEKSILELKESYNQLNKESGGKLPALDAIKSDKELETALTDAMKISGFSSDKLKKIFEKELIGIRGGMTLDSATETLDKLKKEVKASFDRIKFGFDNTKFYKDIEDALAKISGTDGDKWVAEFRIELNNKSIDLAISQIDKELKQAEEKKSLFDELVGFKEETGIDLITDVFAKNVLNYDGYLKELSALKDKYIAQGEKGAEKANETDLLIQKTSNDKLKSNLVQAAQMRLKLATDEERKRIIQGNIDETKAKIGLIDKNLSVEGLSPERKAELEGEKKFYEAKKAMFEYDLSNIEASLYRESDMYQNLYGDIEQYGESTYKRILNRYKAALKLAEATPEYRDKKKYFRVKTQEVDEKGNIVDREVILDAKEYGKAVADIDKKLRNMHNPFKKIGEDFKKAFQKDDITKKIIFNPKSLGEGLEGISQMIQGVKDLSAALGADEYATDMIGGVADGIGAMAKIAINPYDIGAYVELIKSVITLSDADNERNIRNYKLQVAELEKTYEKLQATIKNTAGSVEFDKELQTSIDLLNQMSNKYSLMAKEEEDKKGTKKETVKEYQDKALEYQEKARDLVRSTIDEFSGGVRDAADSFASAWLDAFLEVGSGADALEKTFDDVTKNIVRKQISQAYAKAALAPFIAAIERAVDPTGGVGSEGTMITTKEWKDINDAKEMSKDLWAAYAKEAEKLVGSSGLSGDKSKDLDSLQKGIQGITESTAEVLTSYMNSVRLEVITIRNILQRGSNASGSKAPMSDGTFEIVDIMTKYYPLYLDNLIAIRENTEHLTYLKDAFDASKRGFRMV